MRASWVLLFSLTACGGMVAGNGKESTDSGNNSQASGGATSQVGASQDLELGGTIRAIGVGGDTFGSGEYAATSGGSPMTHSRTTDASMPIGNGGSYSGGSKTEASVDAGLAATGGAGSSAASSELPHCMRTDFAACSACPAPANGIRPVIAGDLFLVTQADVDKLDGIVEITGNLTMNGDLSLRSLHSLCCLEKIGGSLVLNGMYDLGNVDGLSSLRSVGGKVSVTHSNCGNLNLKGLSSLKSVGGDFEVETDQCLLIKSIGAENIGGQIILTPGTSC